MEIGCTSVHLVHITMELRAVKIGGNMQKNGMKKNPQSP